MSILWRIVDSGNPYRMMVDLYYLYQYFTDESEMGKARENMKTTRQYDFLSTLRPYYKADTMISFSDFIHVLNDEMETKESITAMLAVLHGDGWITCEGEGDAMRIQYIPGDDDALWKRRDWMTVEDKSKRNINHMLHGASPEDWKILNFLCEHPEGSTVRQIIGRVFSEDVHMTTFMIHDSLIWLTEQKLATVEEDENGRLLFRAAPQAADAQREE